MSNNTLHRALSCVPPTLRVVIASVVASLVLAASPAVASARETATATRFTVYVPPNNDAGARFSAIVITSAAGTASAPNVVSLIDDAADGDSDDTVENVKLVQGASLVHYIKDGAVNDDNGGAWDGDLMHVRAQQPVSVMLVTDSDWQHTFAPAVDGSLRGQRFFLYANRTSASPRDIDVFAYDDDTRIALYDVSATPLLGSGVTTIRARGAALLTADLNEGESSRVSRGLGVDLLVAGHTYEVITSRPVTVMYGALASSTGGGGMRDGGSMVPGRSGAARDRDFYFSIPHDPGKESEAELRIVAGAAAAAVTLFGYDKANARWAILSNWSLAPFAHADVVNPGAELYRLTSTADVVVFEANWLETGSPGTSDVMSFVPGFVAPDGSQRFISYLGPPGRQVNTSTAGTYTHLYVFSDVDVAGIDAIDVDTGGAINHRTTTVAAGGMADVRYSVVDWSALNQPAQGLRPYIQLDSPTPVAVCMANWNDNWMTYATSVVLRNPDVTLQAPTQVDIGEHATITGVIDNTSGDDLFNIVVLVHLVDGVSYLDGAFNGAAATSVAAEADGGTLVTFLAPLLLAGSSGDLSVTVMPDAGSAGTVVGTDVVVQATDADGKALASSSSAPLVLYSLDSINLSELVAQPATGRVALSWMVDAPAGATGTITVSRAPQATGPFVVLPALTTTVAGPSRNAMTVTDTSVVNGTRYWYRVDATSLGGAAQVGPVTAVPADTEAPPAPTLSGVAGDRRVVLTMRGSQVADLRGYHVYRSRDGVTFTRLTTSPVAGPTWTDTAVENGRAVAYRVAAIDTTGNQSASSPTITLVPRAPATRVDDTVVFFEDMIGAGDNDWDYNDLIVRAASGVTIENGGVRSVVMDIEPLARGAGYIHRLHLALPAGGPWHASVTRFQPGLPFVVDEVRSFSGADTVDVVLYNDTRQALPPKDGAFTNTTSSQSVFEAGAMVHVEVVFDVPAMQPEAALGDAPFDLWLELPWLPMPNAIHLPAYGGAVEAVASGDLAGSDLDFALVVPSVDVVVDWPFEGERLWRPFPVFIDEVVAPSPETHTWHAHPVAAGRTFNQRRGRSTP